MAQAQEEIQERVDGTGGGRFNMRTSAQDEEILYWLVTNTGHDRTGVTRTAWKLLYDQIHHQKLVEEIVAFAREYSGKGELTDEETGYARAMLMVARTLPVEFDDTTDALLDNIEFNKL
jgi:hypothetical protein